MKFRKKPVVIEAIQLTSENFWEVYRWIDTDGSAGEWCRDDDECYITIKTLEGKIKAQENDWIIKGVSGEFYPCKPDIFQLTYDAVEEE